MGEIKNPCKALLGSLTVTLAFTVIGLVIGSMLPMAVVAMMNMVLSLFVLVTFVMFIFTRKTRNSRRGMSMGFVHGYSLFMGVCLYPTINYYIYDLGGNVVLATVIGTLFMVGLLSVIGFKNENDNMLKLGPILMAITFGMAIMSILNMIFGFVPMTQLIMSLVGIVLFSLWVVYDVYSFKKAKPYIRVKNDLAPYVLDLYLSILNLLLNVLRTLSILNDN